MSYTAAVGVLVILVVYKIYRRFSQISIADVPGPAPESFVLGNLRQCFHSLAGETDFQWQAAYGDIVRFKGPFGEDRLFISDPKALQYIYHTSGYNFQKQKERREVSRMLSGRGLLWSDGTIHKRQRKIMNPAFGSKEIKAHVPIFNSCVAMLTNKWKDLLLTSSDQEMVFDLTKWVSKATLDAMGIAGFDYHFGSLDDSNDELGNVFANLIFHAFGKLTEIDILKQSIVAFIPKPIIHFITAKSSNPRLVQLRRSATVASGVARRLIEEKSQALLDGKGNRDVLTLLVKANNSEDERTKMSDEEMISQMRTLLFAGYDATSVTICFIMLEIARHPDIQNKLRSEIRQKAREIHARGDVEFTANDFDSMPYLTAVIKEGVRYHPGAVHMYREASRDDVLPLHTPITTLSGKVITNLPVPKGLKIVTSINAYNRHKDLFGSDAHTFDPERWLTPDRIGKAPLVGAYANLMTFAGGIRSCIGWRFAVLQLESFIVELVSHFEFSMTPKSQKIRREFCLGMAPTIEGEVEKGSQLPLMVKLAPVEE